MFKKNSSKQKKAQLSTKNIFFSQKIEKFVKTKNVHWFAKSVTLRTIKIPAAIYINYLYGKKYPFTSLTPYGIFHAISHLKENFFTEITLDENIEMT